MKTLEEKKERLIDMEWEMFHEVKNEGGPADCQNDPETFRIMRRSQFACWDEDLVDSYTMDLVHARSVGRNLPAEKYAWMMASTAPEEFAAISHLLEKPTEKTVRLIEEIVSQEVEWMAEYEEKYPVFSLGNRELRTSSDTPEETSFETYLRGELYTWSSETVGLYREFIRRIKEEGKNLALLTMETMVKSYGYRDLDEAESIEIRRRDRLLAD